MGTSNYFQATIRKRGLLLSLVAVCALVMVLSSAVQITGQEKQTKAVNQDSAEVQIEANGAALMQNLSVWHILRMTDWLFWPFVTLTAGGLMLLIFRSLVEFQEKRRAEMLYADIDRLRDMQSLLEAIQTSAPNRAASLFRQTVFTFNKTGRAEPIRDDANQFLSGERNSFETFNRVVNFLSDTAGALGLLGTVWGIFATFHSGRLDGPTILQGMSVSLVTTLVGLIISSILNMGGTAVFALFNKQLNLLSSRAEQVRQALLNIEKRTQAQAPMSPTDRRPQNNQSQPVSKQTPGTVSDESLAANNGDNVNHQQDDTPPTVSPNSVPAAINGNPFSQYHGGPMSDQFDDELSPGTPGAVPAAFHGNSSSQYQGNALHDQLDNEAMPEAHNPVFAPVGGDSSAQHSTSQVDPQPNNRPWVPNNSAPETANDGDSPVADNGSLTSRQQGQQDRPPLAAPDYPAHGAGKGNFEQKK